MPTRFSVNINTGNNKNDGETKRSECANIIDVLQKIEQSIMATQTSGTVTDRNGLSHSYTYNPSAAA